MRPHYNLFAAIALGIVLGLAGTYPLLLGSVASLFLWALGGLFLGLFAHGNKQAIWNGAYYGFFLSVSFLYSRFGGTQDQILGYSILVLGLSILGILGGLVTTLLGSKLKVFFK